MTCLQEFLLIQARSDDTSSHSLWFEWKFLCLHHNLAWETCSTCMKPLLDILGPRGISEFLTHISEITLYPETETTWLTSLWDSTQIQATLRNYRLTSNKQQQPGLSRLCRSTQSTSGHRRYNCMTKLDWDRYGTSATAPAVYESVIKSYRTYGHDNTATHMLYAHEWYSVQIKLSASYLKTASWRRTLETSKLSSLSQLVLALVNY